MSLLVAGDGNTPLSPDELNDLIPDLSTREELNEFEFKNIYEARLWALGKSMARNNPLDETYLRTLHRRMFNQTWKWAGNYRTTEKTIGVLHHQIRDNLMVLIGDTKYQIENQSYEPDEIAVRFHHRLVFIHPFPNGNGRHSRAMADILCVKYERAPFSWGSLSRGANRLTYIAALRAADNHNIKPLLAFARSV